MLNLALGAVFLATLLFPALALVYVFGNGTHARRLPSFTLVEYFLLSSVLSILIHWIAIGFMRQFLHLQPEYVFIFKFLTNQVALDNEPALQDQLKVYFSGFASYTLIVCTSCGIAGWIIQKFYILRWLRTRPLVQKFRRNRRPNAMFCYFNDWWYFFRANEYSSDFPADEPLIFTDVVIDTKDATILYSGILVDFVLNKDGLEFIYLKSVSKRIFSTKNADGSVVLVDDNAPAMEITNAGIMCIPYSKIINLYIRFANLVLATNQDLANLNLQNIEIVNESNEANESEPTTGQAAEPSE